MSRLGGTTISETTPLISSSAAKEESLSDMIKVVSQYANIIVLRHPDSDEVKMPLTIPVFCKRSDFKLIKL